MRTSWLALLLLLAACQAPVVPGSPEACQVEHLETLPLRVSAGMWLVDVRIDGKPAAMVLDTGANGSALFDHAVQRLKTPVADGTFVVVGMDGAAIRRAVSVGTLTLGTQVTASLTLPELDGMKSGRLPYDGLLGMDVLGQYDIEVHGPSDTLILYRGRTCAAGPPPFPDAHPMPKIDDRGPMQTRRPAIQATLNGHPQRTLLDTGSPRSVVDTARATAAGGSAPRGGTAPHGLLQAVGDAPVLLRLMYFAEFQVAGTTYRNSDLWTMKLDTLADVVVGRDILARRRMWYSPGSGMVFMGPYVPPPGEVGRRASGAR